MSILWLVSYWADCIVRETGTEQRPVREDVDQKVEAKGNYEQRGVSIEYYACEGNDGHKRDKRYGHHGVTHNGVHTLELLANHDLFNQ